MAAQTDDRNILEKYNPAAFRHDYLGANATQFFKGCLVGISGATGLLKKAAAADVNLQVVGVSEDTILTTNATTRIGCRSGIFLFAGSATAADVGKYAFVVDDQTVSATNASDDPVAGVIYDINAATDPGGAGVWVAINYPAGSNAKGTTAAGVGALSPFSGA